MLRGDAAARDALRIECDHLEQLAVAFEFLLILLCCVEQQFDELLTAVPFVA